MQLTDFNAKNIQNIKPDLRPDLQESLKQSQIEPAKLSTFQRILLTTDGTLTEILEAYLFEKIYIVKLSEDIIPIAKNNQYLEINAGHEIIDRKILLRGRISQNNWMYAESVIVPDRLNEVFREGLLKSKEAMGRLWLENRIETFKEIVASHRQAAGELAQYFQIDPEEQLLSRTYCVFSNQQAMMTITEKFPESYFTKTF